MRQPRQLGGHVLILRNTFNQRLSGLSYLTWRHFQLDTTCNVVNCFYPNLLSYWTHLAVVHVSVILLSAWMCLQVYWTSYVCSLVSLCRHDALSIIINFFMIFQTDLLVIYVTIITQAYHLSGISSLRHIIPQAWGYRSIRIYVGILCTNLYVFV